jgi:hypothetical protein
MMGAEMVQKWAVLPVSAIAGADGEFGSVFCKMGGPATLEAFDELLVASIKEFLNNFTQE